MEPHTIAEGTKPSEEREEVSLARAFGGRSMARDIVETLLLTLVIFLVVNALTGRFQVRGSSMEPSLHSSQYLIVSKLSYRLEEPQRGDIIVFEPPNGASEDYIKRIIGLPGERVEARDGSIWIDGYQLEEPYAASSTPYSGSWQLGPQEYFVLGDNRANSSDSHSWGTLPTENIVGKTLLCYWPPQYWGPVPHHHFSDFQEQE
ncbi:MAG: signal peptidase I [Anaerolineae bacterium]